MKSSFQIAIRDLIKILIKLLIIKPYDEPRLICHLLINRLLIQRKSVQNLRRDVLCSEEIRFSRLRL